ncbi:MAG: hypothetical protein M1820_007222 [Bogoriella megaspora]|nr:MAG: hypothetical protein M1820_007222 [Bogoriella megaspora]
MLTLIKVVLEALGSAQRHVEPESEPKPQPPLPLRRIFLQNGGKDFRDLTQWKSKLAPGEMGIVKARDNSGEFNDSDFGRNNLDHFEALPYATDALILFAIAQVGRAGEAK